LTRLHLSEQEYIGIEGASSAINSSLKTDIAIFKKHQHEKRSIPSNFICSQMHHQLLKFKVRGNENNVNCVQANAYYLLRNFLMHI
jgi:hypothetical protein